VVKIGIAGQGGRRRRSSWRTPRWEGLGPDQSLRQEGHAPAATRGSLTKPVGQIAHCQGRWRNGFHSAAGQAPRLERAATITMALAFSPDATKVGQWLAGSGFSQGGGTDRTLQFTGQGVLRMKKKDTEIQALAQR